MSQASTAGSTASVVANTVGNATDPCLVTPTIIDIQRTFAGHTRGFSDAELCKRLAAEYGFSSVESYKQAIMDGGIPSSDIEALAEKFRHRAKDLTIACGVPEHDVMPYVERVKSLEVHLTEEFLRRPLFKDGKIGSDLKPVDDEAIREVINFPVSMAELDTVKAVLAKEAPSVLRSFGDQELQLRIDNLKNKQVDTSAYIREFTSIQNAMSVASERASQHSVTPVAEVPASRQSSVARSIESEAAISAFTETMKEFLDRSAKGNTDLAASNRALADEQRRSADAQKRIAELTEQQQEQSKGDRMETFLQKLDERFSILFRENKELMSESTDVEADILLIFDRAIRNKSMMKFLESNPIHTRRLIDILISVKDDSIPSKSEARFVSDMKRATQGATPSPDGVVHRDELRLLFRVSSLMPAVDIGGKSCVGLEAVVAACADARKRAIPIEAHPSLGKIFDPKYEAILLPVDGYEKMFPSSSVQAKGSASQLAPRHLSGEPATAANRPSRGTSPSTSKVASSSQAPRDPAAPSE